MRGLLLFIFIKRIKISYARNSSANNTSANNTTKQINFIEEKKKKLYIYL